MRAWAWLAVWGAACGGDGEDAAPTDDATTAEGDSDTDADADADTDTTPPPAPEPYTCLDGPCDSDPIGKWTVLGECLEDPRLAAFVAACPDITVNYFPGEPDGTLTFDATTYLFEASGGTTGIEMLVPGPCNPNGCLTFEVSDLDLRCNTDGSAGCECQGTWASRPFLDSGTWTRDQGSLDLSSAATAGQKTFDFCATDDALWLFDPVREIAIAARRAL
jgi:hypothetical protein